TALDAFGITAGEREVIGSIYDAGSSLWRVPVTHFTPWDHNFPYGPGGGDCSPMMCAGGPDEPSGDDEDPDPCEQMGSIIECQNQTLREDIPLVGTSHSLVYDTARTPGYRAAHQLRIPVTG